MIIRRLKPSSLNHTLSYNLYFKLKIIVDYKYSIQWHIEIKKRQIKKQEIKIIIFKSV